jgi:tartrate dehydrogenase/decarboxylase/D-malate dehydrogenase
LEHIGEAEAAAQLMWAIESVTANQDMHTPDLGGNATTKKVTDALIAHIQCSND